MLEETGVEDAADLGFMLLRALQHLTRERRGRALAKRLLLYDIQGQLVQHSCRASQHMPNGLQQQADVRAEDRPLGQIVPALVFPGRLSSTLSSRSSSSAASSSLSGRRQIESFSLCCRHSSRCHAAPEARRSSFQIDAGQLRATGHHRGPAAAFSSPIVRLWTALPCAVVSVQVAVLLEARQSALQRSS